MCLHLRVSHVSVPHAPKVQKSAEQAQQLNRLCFGEAVVPDVQVDAHAR